MAWRHYLNLRNIGLFSLLGLGSSYAIMRARAVQHKVPRKGDFAVHISRSGGGI